MMVPRVEQVEEQEEIMEKTEQVEYIWTTLRGLFWKWQHQFLLFFKVIFDSKARLRKLVYMPIWKNNNHDRKMFRREMI